MIEKLNVEEELIKIMLLFSSFSDQQASSKSFDEMEFIDQVTSSVKIWLSFFLY